MLGELLAAAVQRQQEQDTLMRAICAAVARQGGVIEIPFTEMDAVAGGLALEVDGDRKVVILRAMTEAEMEAQVVLAESVGEEKH